MNITDLKLLVDTAYTPGGELRVDTGFLAARDRLVRLGLLIKKPDDDRFVRITKEGEEFIGLKLSSTAMARSKKPR